MKLENYIKQQLRESLSRLPNQDAIDSVLDRIGDNNYHVGPYDRAKLDNLTGNAPDVSGLPFDQQVELWLEANLGNVHMEPYGSNFNLISDKQGEIGMISIRDDGERRIYISGEVTAKAQKTFRVSKQTVKEVISKWLRQMDITL